MSSIGVIGSSTSVAASALLRRAIVRPSPSLVSLIAGVGRRSEADSPAVAPTRVLANVNHFQDVGVIEPAVRLDSNLVRAVRPSPRLRQKAAQVFQGGQGG